MTITYTSVILVSWFTFLLVWSLLALSVKRDIRGGFAGAWSQYWLLRLAAIAVFIIFVAIRVATGTAHYTNPGSLFSHNPFFSHNLFVPSPTLDWIAAALTVIGNAFAIWARFCLGRNWSSRPTAKEGHELVTSGPYAYVRHPIYTGIILAALGATILMGSILGIGVVAISSVMFLSRINKEEKIMLELFPNEYPAYQKQTKRLLPFVW